MVSRTFFTKALGRQHTGDGMTLRHLIQHLAEEPLLELSRLLQEGVGSCSPFGLAEDSEPLFYSAQLVFEVLIKRSGSHLFKSGFVLLDVSDPLVSDPVSGVFRVTLVVRMLRREDLR